jgi:hypothetical protein
VHPIGIDKKNVAGAADKGKHAWLASTALSSLDVWDERWAGQAGEYASRRGPREFPKRLALPPKRGAHPMPEGQELDAETTPVIGSPFEMASWLCRSAIAPLRRL